MNLLESFMQKEKQCAKGDNKIGDHTDERSNNGYYVGQLLILLLIIHNFLIL